jgi:hypothetical protein
MEDGGAADANDASSPTSGQREVLTVTPAPPLLSVTPAPPFLSVRRAPSDEALSADRTLEMALLLLSVLRRQGTRDGDREAQGLGVGDAYRSGRVPASREAVAGLRVTTVAAAETREELGECAVCLQSYEEGDRVKVMPCSHRFHESCIVRWLGISRLCPLCRFALHA